MSDNVTINKAPLSAKVKKYDVTNPCRGRRIIFDGVEGSNKSISIEPGETKTGIILSDHIVAEMAERNKVNKGSDLIIVEAA